MENIILNFISSDFEGNSFMDNDDCAVARAFNRQMNTRNGFATTYNVTGGTPMKTYRFGIVTINSNSPSQLDPEGKMADREYFEGDHFRYIRRLIADDKFISATVELKLEI